MIEQEQIKKAILQIVESNMAWCNPNSDICLEQNKRHPNRFPKGSTFQSAEEVLNDIIVDLSALQRELEIRRSFVKG